MKFGPDMYFYEFYQIPEDFWKIGRLYLLPFIIIAVYNIMDEMSNTHYSILPLIVETYSSLATWVKIMSN